MKKVSILFVATLIVTVWMAGSWIFFNSTAVGAQESDTPAVADSQKSASPDSAMDRGRDGHFKGRHGRHHKFFKKLNLSDAQKKQIRSIRDEERANMRPLKQKLREGRNELSDLRKSGPFDEPKVRAIAKGQADTLTDLIVAKERMKSRIYDVLTPDQRAKAEKMRESWKSRKKGPKS